MMDGNSPTSGPALVNDKSEFRAENNFGEPETVEIECLCCSTDRFRFVRHFHSEGRTRARFECVGCGATSDRRVPAPGSETA